MKALGSIDKEIHFKADIDRVWQAITSPEEVGQWFGQKASFELRAGSIGWFRWDKYGQFTMRVEVVEPKNYFAWRWMANKGEAFDESASTLVEWRLRSTRDGGTQLQLRESGFRSPASREDNVGGWKAELQDLTTFLEDSSHS